MPDKAYRHLWCQGAFRSHAAPNFPSTGSCCQTQRGSGSLRKPAAGKTNDASAKIWAPAKSGHFHVAWGGGDDVASLNQILLANQAAVPPNLSLLSHLSVFFWREINRGPVCCCSRLPVTPAEARTVLATPGSSKREAPGGSFLPSGGLSLVLHWQPRRPFLCYFTSVIPSRGNQFEWGISCISEHPMKLTDSGVWLRKTDQTCEVSSVL